MSTASTTTATPAAHKFRKGQSVRIIAGPNAGRAGKIVFTEPVQGNEASRPAEWIVSLGGEPLGGHVVRESDIEAIPAEPAKPARPEPVPPPAGHQWAIGDRVLVTGCEGESAMYVRRIDDEGRHWLSGHPSIGLGWYGVMADRLRMPEVEPDSPPTAAQPATHLNRVEYRDDWDLVAPPSHKAALIPIAGIAERLRLADILSLLSENTLADEDESSDDEFLIHLIGGHPVRSYAVGDRVTVVGGDHTGEVWHLAERDEANGQRWWLARESGGQGVLGLHVDGFARADGGGE